jgi:PucR C-terminal helix-turn-helix domain
VGKEIVTRNYAGSTNDWLDREARTRLEVGLSELAGRVAEAIQLEVPEYGRPLEGEFGRNVRLGTELALRRFVGEELDGSQADLHRRLGAGEYRAGRSLDALQSAYRIGARVAWRAFSDAAAAAGASAQAQRSLAEAMFAYIDRLAGESVEGYAEAQLEDVNALERQRSELAELLLGNAIATDAELARAAEAARWPLPRSVACLAVAGDQADRAGRYLSGDLLQLRLGETIGIVGANVTMLEREAERAAQRLDVTVGVGPSVALREASSSMRFARWALELATVGSPVRVADRQLADIALNAVPEVLIALHRQLLAPLDSQTPASKKRLEATLLSWLRHRGAQGRVAAELAIHPQTVRYRMARIRELIGDLLDDPEQRFALEMVLRHAR